MSWSEVEMPSRTSLTRRAILSSWLGLMLAGCGGVPEIHSIASDERGLKAPQLRTGNAGLTQRVRVRPDTGESGARLDAPRRRLAAPWSARNRSGYALSIGKTGGMRRQGRLGWSSPGHATQPQLGQRIRILTGKGTRFTQTPHLVVPFTNNVAFRSLLT